MKEDGNDVDSDDKVPDGNDKIPDSDAKRPDSDRKGPDDDGDKNDGNENTSKWGNEEDVTTPHNGEKSVSLNC